MGPIRRIGPIGWGPGVGRLNILGAQALNVAAAAFSFQDPLLDSAGTLFGFLPAQFLGFGAAGRFFLAPLALDLVQEPAPGQLAIHRLGTRILNADRGPAGDVPQLHTGGNLVHVLATGARGARKLFLKIGHLKAQLRQARRFFSLEIKGRIHTAAPTMEVIIKPDSAAVSKTAAQYFQGQLLTNPRSVLGLATGATPVGLYRELIALKGSGEIDFSSAVSFNLDEYVGIPAEHPASYHSFMRDNLFAHIGMAAENNHLPDGMAEDIQAHCSEYEAAIRSAGGIDLQLLGLGSDGHIGFNEPSSSLSSRTRLKTLTPRTIADNARYFGGEQKVPRHVVTMGVGTIMEARHCLVLALGAQKAAAVAAMVEGPISATSPASILQMHPHCTLIIDEAASSALARGDYYRWVYDHKPKWQTFQRSR